MCWTILHKLSVLYAICFLFCFFNLYLVTYCFFRPNSKHLKIDMNLQMHSENED